MPAIKACGKIRDIPPRILNLAKLAGSEWEDSRPGSFTPGKRHNSSL